MKLSLNEIEATAKRAARGAGYSWGHAEEAGKATRWLCAHGLGGVEALVQLLDLSLTSIPEAHTPEISGEVWAGQNALCPLAAGAAVSDCAQQLTKAPISLNNVALPVLILPFAANAAQLLETVVTVEFDGSDITTDGHSLTLPTALPDHAQLISVRLGGTLAGPVALQSRATPDQFAWAALNRFAHRTYAPATEESRLRGAGAGLSDND